VPRVWREAGAAAAGPYISARTANLCTANERTTNPEEGDTMTTTNEVTAEQRSEIIRQIGWGNILSISGGRVLALRAGIHLPVSNGYAVRVRLTAMDDYTVERIFTRKGVEYSHGTREHVYCDEVAEVAYRAGMFRSYDDDEF
jgi:hypothetical protein